MADKCGAKATKRGRPSKFQPEIVEQAQKLARLGATDKEMADFFGVAERTFHDWKKVHPEFLQSLKAGKLLADANVADALYHRAIGYSHPDVHVSNFQGAITLTPLVKHYPPDTAAAFIWLKNRRPDLWRDRVDPNKDDDSEPLESKSFTYNVVDGRTDDGDAH